MKFVLLTIGKTSDGVLRTAIDGYVKRLGHYVPFEFRTLTDVKTGKSVSSERQKELEGKKFLEVITPGDHVILLDERGKMMTSREFAVKVESLMVNMPRNVYFVIGGPYGFSREMYARADAKVSLSLMTLTHEMVRLLFVEQLYRAMTIIRGEPYHHD